MQTISEEAFNVALGKRLMLLRQANRLSQDMLGAYIGVRGQQVHKYETGENRITPEKLAACARLFGVSVGYFYGEEERGVLRGFDKTILTVAAEINELPPDIRQSVYTLSRQINKLAANQVRCG
jgi:transcriptional regulator with XRE-family HTH domain